MEIEARQQLESLVADLTSFIGTKVHEIYVSDTKRTLDAVKENILELDPLAPDTAANFAYLQGQKLVLASNLTLFEDTVDTLKNRIQAILNEEQQIPRSNNQVDDEEI